MVARLVVVVFFAEARFVALLLPLESSEASADAEVSPTLPVAAMTSAGGSLDAVAELSEDGAAVSVRPYAGG